MTNVFLAGELGVKDQQNRIRAALILNRTGPWTKSTNQNPEQLLSWTTNVTNFYQCASCLSKEKYRVFVFQFA
jgi:hypothetical protein